ncbi:MULTISPECIES: hypothetical protein [unclassified Streptomyces]|uniref:hypothetical protein n=1 Tax=unclassified Streptomyces TaxID=2593676 RepID=UPI000DC7B421|nr:MULTISPECIES: hypothetical protein [unclassified Streptomyces]AWZ09878.1 hypothetical protein DRB89_41965 [Streptomyces sp. ICC4]AWZ12355.1 hypothetical protein DRB96_08500 [Streptomyces sp. ICC1]
MPATAPYDRPLLDPALAIPALAPLRAATLAGESLAAAFETVSDEDDRTLACRVVASTPGSEEFLRRTVEELPHDPLARTLYADRLVTTGWEIRTGARAAGTAAGRAADFRSHLLRAEGLLIGVCAEHPEYALAWHLRVITARGLELGQSETRRRYDRLAEHHPHHHAGQQQLLQQLCPKWGGSWEAAQSFADDCARRSRPGSPAAVLGAVVQLERWLELAGTDPDEAEDHVEDPARRTELERAAAASVLHPDFDSERHHAIAAHGVFAAVHCLASRWREAAPHFRALGNRMSAFPWEYLDSDPVAEFARHREIALGRGAA